MGYNEGVNDIVTTMSLLIVNPKGRRRPKGNTTSMMKSHKRFTLALTSALMTTTLAVSPAMAQPEAPDLGDETTTSVSATLTTDDAESDSTQTVTKTVKKKSSSASKKKQTDATVTINADKTTSTIDGDTTAFSINISYDKLKAGKEYQAQFTITDSDGEVIADRQPENFSAKKESGNKAFKLSLAGSIDTATVAVDIVDRKNGIVASTDDEVEVVAGEDEGVDPSISTTASLDTDVIQTGSQVSDIIAYEGFIPGETYTVETTLMCKSDEQSTGAEKTSEFTPDEAQGEFEVKDIEVADPDCLEQVVFEVIKDEDGTVVAEHTDIDDQAQTVGGERDGKKKKKKSVPAATIANAPVRTAPQAVADANANAVTPPGDRATIGSVPSGEFSNYGATLFDR